MSVGEIQAGKCLKEEAAAWGTASNIHILDSGRQVLGKWVIGEVILRPFSVKPFVTIAMVGFNQLQLSLSNALRRQIAECSCSSLMEASKMRCIKMVGNSLRSPCSSCSSPDPSNVPPAETHSHLHLPCPSLSILCSFALSFKNLLLSAITLSAAALLSMQK